MKERKPFCRKLPMMDYHYCMKPDALVEFLDNEEHERLQKYQQRHLNKHNDLVRAHRMFEKDLREAAQKEIKRLLDGKTDIDAEYEHMEFMALLQFAMGDDEAPWRISDMNIRDLADVLGVPIPPKIEEQWKELTEEGSYIPGLVSTKLIERVDAIIEHLGIELPEEG